MSTVPPIKFRCFQCNKLLGVSRSKANSVVSCPQCSAELIVPDHSDPPAAAPGDVPPPPAKKPSPSNSRIEPVVVLWDKSPDPDPDPAGTADSGFPVIQVEPLSLRPEKPSLLRSSSRSRSEDWPETTEGPIPANLRPQASPSPNPPPRQDAPLAGVVKIEPPALREEAASVAPAPSLRESAARRNDVVLPRTVAVLWSFLVLLAVVLAFATGLLAGRFLWAPGVGVRSAVVGPTEPAKPSG